MIGRLTKIPEARVTTSGTNVTAFTLAVSRKFKNDSGEYEADYPMCKAFGKTGELINKYCDKGDLIGIEGNIRTGSYTDKDGNKCYTTNIIVESVEFLKKKNAQKNENIVQKEEKPEEQTDIFADFGEEVNVDDNFLD